LSWDLGETRGTVAIRMPLHAVALDLLRQTGPLAVSSANISGAPAATSADQAESQLGGAVAVVLDGGHCDADVPSTIVDLTGPLPRLLREGAIPLERLTAVTPMASLPAQAPWAPAAPAADDPAAAGDHAAEG
jgi:tRNA threonylcarbamoyl adenosine modification protein (Sua5/YciO/YrdC/YwlC family)